MKSILEYLAALAILIVIFAAANFLMGSKITFQKTVTTTTSQQCIDPENKGEK